MSDFEDLLEWQIKLAKLEVPEREFYFARHIRRLWRFDFAWPDRLLAAEVDGGTWIAGRHTRGQGFEKDCEKMSNAAALGWRVLRFTSRMVDDGQALALVEQALAFGNHS